MGTYYFQTDVENITLEPSVYLLKNKLKISSSFGHQLDNLLDKKSYTTKRFILNIGLDWNVSQKFGFNALYANYSGEQGKGLKIPNQATQQSFVSQNLMLMPRLTFVKEKMSHFHTLMANRQWMTDRNPNTAKLTEYVVDNLNYNSNFLFNTSGLTVGVNYLFSNFDSENAVNKLNSVRVNVSKPFLNNKMNLSATANWTKQDLNGVHFAGILNFSLQNMYQINVHHGLTLRGVYLDNKAKMNKVMMKIISLLVLKLVGVKLDEVAQILVFRKSGASGFMLIPAQFSLDEFKDEQTEENSIYEYFVELILADDTRIRSEKQSINNTY